MGSVKEADGENINIFSKTIWNAVGWDVEIDLTTGEQLHKRWWLY